MAFPLLSLYKMFKMIEINPQDFDDFAALQGLLQSCFAFMAGRIDPPSSLDMMSQADLRAKAKAENLILFRDETGAPMACLFAVQQGNILYLGKLAVAQQLRGQGIARALIGVAENLARDLGLQALELQTRVELTENHACFTRLGFRETARVAHAGYDHPTSICFQRML